MEVENQWPAIKTDLKQSFAPGELWDWRTDNLRSIADKWASLFASNVGNFFFLPPTIALQLNQVDPFNVFYDNPV